jgi:DNA (cytosine-5)-methyltransferase 1
VNYYNENDPYAAQWLRNLIAAGHIAPGDVDTRSIVDVRATDLVGYSQCHFFAGIGGWDHALNLAGWHGPVWTGSCPCQPLSSAGRQRGHADERHLWPAFHALIAQCRPATVFGEQVASKDGREWLAGVRADLEGTGYACGAADLCAAGAGGAPHIRQRLYWVADAKHDGSSRIKQFGGTQDQGWLFQSEGCSAFGGLGDADDARPQGRDGRALGRERQTVERAGRLSGFWDAYDLVPCSDGKTRRTGPGIFPLAHGVSGGLGRVCAACIQANAEDQDDEVLRSVREVLGSTDGRLATEILRKRLHGQSLHQESGNSRGGPLSGSTHVSGSRVRGLWQDRPISSSSSQGPRPDEQHSIKHHDSVRGLPHERTSADACSCCGREVDWLADAIIRGNRIGRLRAYGNAIVPPLAAEFIAAFMEAT